MDERAKIKNAYMDYLSGNGKVDVSLEIHLDNGQIVILTLNDRGNDSRFADILAGKKKDQPQTDGESIYWSGGPRLTLDEIIAILRGGKPLEEESHKRWKSAAIPFGICAVIASVILTVSLSLNAPMSDHAPESDRPMANVSTMIEEGSVPLAMPEADEDNLMLECGCTCEEPQCPGRCKH